ncbi:SMR family transporter [Selenomonas ruminis]|uniref:QacE family quaternary ammonium compound efflux SMR transporter n=1 Tax=Selenomonas ruminis TaxID=2593411 RepID=A0A5D6WDL1_9FIRM|nr:SMR family transporter [Selenomonas sp. mPRGC5]TYZ25125.1 hypothetical protein FZ040_03665 [Selenomonas sp. mPRGC5]
MLKGYILLAIAIALEIVSTSMLKASCGFTKLMPRIVCTLTRISPIIDHHVFLT